MKIFEATMKRSEITRLSSKVSCYFSGYDDSRCYPHIREKNNGLSWAVSHHNIRDMKHIEDISLPLGFLAILVFIEEEVL